MAQTHIINLTSSPCPKGIGSKNAGSARIDRGGRHSVDRELPEQPDTSARQTRCQTMTVRIRGIKAPNA